MEHPGFFEKAGPFTVREIAQGCEAEPAPAGSGGLLLGDLKPLSEAGPGDLTFLDNKKYLPQLAATRAGACLIQSAFVGRLPAATIGIVSRAPYRSFALALAKFYPTAMRPQVCAPGARLAVDPTAQIEAGAEIQPGAVIGAGAIIGRGTIVAAGAVVGFRCTVGRDCFIGAGATVTHALIGDRVILHAGVRIGQDGFGFAMGPRGHLKVPQIGRVIIQDDVEIGANTTVDRGSLKDTIIGEGSKIDNLVQIGHNVVMGRHCVIVGQSGIAGSTEIGDFVVMGGQSGFAGHMKVGTGVQLAGASHAKDDIPAGMKLAGTPAKPLREWMKELLAVERIASGNAAPAKPDKLADE